MSAYCFSVLCFRAVHSFSQTCLSQKIFVFFELSKVSGKQRVQTSKIGFDVFDLAYFRCRCNSHFFKIVVLLCLFYIGLFDGALMQPHN